ncbi:acyl-coenzyme A synthetase/AMP-(fatty) acid ligase [Oxalobacteraceae bacterium GrIS 2.11]
MSYPLSNFAGLDPTSQAIVGWRNGVPVSRRELVTRIAAWRDALAQQSGQQFALFFEDSIEFAAALFGAWHAGKTIWLSADNLAATVAALADKVDGFVGEFPLDYAPVSAPGDAGGRCELNQLDPDFIAVVVHTSGTSGAAQAIPKKLAQLSSEVATLELMFGERLEGAEIVATVSHQHIYGLLFKVLWPLYAGRAIHAQAVIYPEQLALHLADRLADHLAKPGRAVITSPAHLKRLPGHLTWGPAQAVFCSGGVLSAEVALAATLGSVPIEVYGSSETGGIAWRQRTSLTDDAWQAMTNVAWRCVDQLIEVRSPHLFANEWLILADRIAPQPDGKFVLLGRSDRIVKLEEKRISLDAVEQQLARSPLVSEIKLVLGSERARKRQHLAAAVVLSEVGEQVLQELGKLAVNQQLKAYLIDLVEPVAVPRSWRYVSALPQDAQGKTSEALLQALFSDAPLTAPIYRLCRHEQHEAEYEVSWPEQLHYFVGHFENAPVLPGVAQVHWAIRIGREIFDVPDAFHAMHGLKFHHVVFPNEQTRLKLNYDAHKKCLSFSYTSASKQHSSGKIFFNANA